MTLDVDDTIAAIASAPGGGLRGIVRVSGTRCAAILTTLFRGISRGAPAGLPTIAWPTCQRGTVELGDALGLVPATVYFWPTERSYTRQPSIEFHLPGSPPLLEAALAAVCQAGARLAQPGEFTLRAFLAGRLDLTQAEAVLGVIEARGQRELESALAQLGGGLARPLAELRERLLDLLAQLEAGLDFVDEDIEFVSAAELESELKAAAHRLDQILQQMQSRGEAGSVPRVVIVGLPNAGKSSLLNALAGEEAAIVSPTAGTTRDFVTCRVRVGQRIVLVTDTAGERPDGEIDEVDQAAQAAAHGAIEQADLTILCVDASCPVTDWEEKQLRGRSTTARLLVWTKCDLADAHQRGVGDQDAVRTSSRTGMGLDALRQAIARALDAADGEAGGVAGTADRCRESLQRAGEALARARGNGGQKEELVAAELRVALAELGQVVGAVYTDDILDRVFSRFCIGK